MADEDPCKKLRDDIKKTPPEEPKRKKFFDKITYKKHFDNVLQRFQIKDLQQRFKNKALERFNFKGLQRFNFKDLQSFKYKDLNVEKNLKNGLIFIQNNAWNWIKQLRDLKTTMADQASKTHVGRPMRYPYTYTARIVQFPWKFYFKNQWMWRYLAYASVLCLPVFYYIEKLSYSPANVAKWKEIRRKEREEQHF